MPLFARLFTRREPPSLASGLTLDQWDQLYGRPFLNRRMARFRKVALWSGLLAFVLGALGVKLSRPGYPAGGFLFVILLAAFLNFVVCVLCTLMLFADWAFDRYGDKHSYQTTEGKNRGKYRIRKN